MATLEAIQARIQKLQGQAAELEDQSKHLALAKIRDLMIKHDVTLEQIEGALSKKGRGASVAKKGATSSGAPIAKYRNPKTGATWSGRGRRPAWMGKRNFDRFLIEAGASDSSAVSTAVKASAKKPEERTKHTVAPKYRDPASGTTWSGRGLAPLWIRGAKDRTAYLIA
ncbi:H-NS histone family protein [Paraburkholderia sp. J8-2]|uniref:H-NS histone family protein n=1 Tax=Paraburkholderia sp. J8-2 TaxID=2805440 RepID=UPI002AB7A1E8|nr:H-NS family nucleoid-associated regulatory protein [Paraburkholderia sp. J8-2]